MRLILTATSKGKARDDDDVILRCLRWGPTTKYRKKTRTHIRAKFCKALFATGFESLDEFLVGTFTKLIVGC